MMAALLLLLGPAAGPAVFYTAPADATKRDAASHVFPRHDVGAVVYAAVDEANLRSAPAVEAPVVTVLTLGTPVTVQEVRDGVDTIEARVDTWYRVTTAGADGGTVEGFLFGAALTPLRFVADLDEDGEAETATVSMGWDYQVRVRVLEPAVSGKDRVASASIEPAGGAFLGVVGGTATADLVPARTAGLPLVHLYSAPEACADNLDAWLSYRSPGRGKPGKLRVALEAHGMLDPPVFSRISVTWDRKRKGATLIRTNDEESEEGKPIKSVTRTRYRLRQGVYVEQK